MQFYLDTFDVKEIAQLSELGLVDGVTTNPSIIAQSGRRHFEVLKDICSIINSSVSAEVLSDKYDDMLKEADELLNIGPQITIKLPLTFDGLKACKKLTDNGIKVNLTLCFSVNQALLAAKANATYISPFVGRLDDIGLIGINLIDNIVKVYQNYPQIFTKILVASIRSSHHIIEAARMGADVITAPPHIIRSMINHPLTDKGIEIFNLHK